MASPNRPCLQQVSWSIAEMKYDEVITNGSLPIAKLIHGFPAWAYRLGSFSGVPISTDPDCVVEISAKKNSPEALVE